MPPAYPSDAGGIVLRQDLTPFGVGVEFARKSNTTSNLRRVIMQAPAQHAATYNVVPITTINAMVTEYEQLPADIQGAQGGGTGFKKALPANMLQAKIARKGQLEPAIKHQLDTDIDAIHRNYVRHGQAVETMRTMAKDRLDHAKAA